MNSKMKILTVDIETSPNLVWVWGLFNQNIAISQVVEPTFIMTWAAKWHGQKQVHFRRHTDDDFLEKIWELLDQADAVVHWHGKRFDIPHLNREFLEEGMVPPSNYFEIDLYQVVKSRFRFTSNKLQFVAQEILGTGKLPTGGFGLWTACLDGHEWAWRKMRQYNIQDVVITDRLYDKLKGWVKNHPNHALYVEDQENPICRNCGSDKVKNNGPEYDTTGVFAYQRLKCMEIGCGANLRGRDAIKGSKKVSMQVVK